MKLTPKQYAQALHDAASETNDKDYEILIDNLLSILKKRGEAYMLPEIIAEFEDLSSSKTQEIEVSVASQGSINSEIIEHINNAVKNLAEIKQKIDSNLMGGVVIRTEDTLIDASLRSKLDKLSNELIK